MQSLLINVYKAMNGGNSTFSFLEMWQQLVPAVHRDNYKRALKLEQLFKYHSTFMNFNRAGVLEFNYKAKWISQSEEQHGTKHYTNVVSNRNRFKI